MSKQRITTTKKKKKLAHDHIAGKLKANVQMLVFWFFNLSSFSYIKLPLEIVNGDSFATKYKVLYIHYLNERL